MLFLSPNVCYALAAKIAMKTGWHHEKFVPDVFRDKDIRDFFMRRGKNLPCSIAGPHRKE